VRFMFKRSYYDVSLRVQGVNGFGETWRSVSVGTLRDCRNYVDKVARPMGYGWKVAKVKVVAEQDGRLATDYLRQLFRGQLFDDLAEVLNGHFPELSVGVVPTPDER